MPEAENKIKPRLKAESRPLNLFFIRFYKPLVLAMMMAVLLFGYLLLIHGQMEQLKNSRQHDLPNLKKAVAQLEAKKQIFTQYPAGVFGLTPSEERLLGLALPASFDLPSVVIQLTALADKFGFLVSDIKVNGLPDNGNEPSGARKVNLKVKIAGNDYNHFKNFLSALESSIMIFDASAVSFSLKDATYELDLATYYYPNP